MCQLLVPELLHAAFVHPLLPFRYLLKWKGWPGHCSVAISALFRAIACSFPCLLDRRRPLQWGHFTAPGYLQSKYLWMRGMEQLHGSTACSNKLTMLEDCILSLNTLGSIALQVWMATLATNTPRDVIFSCPGVLLHSRSGCPAPQAPLRRAAAAWPENQAGEMERCTTEDIPGS